MRLTPATLPDGSFLAVDPPEGRVDSAQRNYGHEARVFISPGLACVGLSGQRTSHGKISPFCLSPRRGSDKPAQGRASRRSPRSAALG